MVRARTQHDPETAREAHPTRPPARCSGDAIGRLQRDAGNRATTLAIQRWKSTAGQVWDYETFAQPPARWKLTKVEGGLFAASEETPAIVRDALTHLTTKRAVRDFIDRYKQGDIKDDSPVPDRTPVVVAPPARPNFPSDQTKGVFLADPSMIRYSQDSVGGTFANGRALTAVAEDLRTGRIGAEDFPEIRIIQLKTKGGFFLFVSMDNRRLWVFRTAGVNIRCRWISRLTENDKRKMTGGTGQFGTENIVVRDY